MHLFRIEALKERPMDGGSRSNMEGHGHECKGKDDMT
jgi:hypothetical protein